MKKEQKTTEIANLKEKFENSTYFYIADSAGLTVEEVNTLRAKCFENGIEMKVAKNTLIKKALESIEGGGYEEIYDSLKGPTSIFFTQVAKAPAQVFTEFRGKEGEKPMLKAAYIDTAVYIGDESLKELKSIKSKEEVIGDIIALLQSPPKNVISALKSGGSTLAGLIKTLADRPE